MFIGYVYANEDLYDYMQELGYTVILKPTINIKSYENNQDQEVYDLDFSLRYFSKINDLTEKDLFIEELDQIYSNNNLIDQTLLEKLIDWRTINLKIDSNLIDILPYSILEIIAVLKPFNRYQLESFPGMNSHKIKKYARELLVIVQEHALGHLNVPDYS